MLEYIILILLIIAILLLIVLLFKKDEKNDLDDMTENLIQSLEMIKSNMDGSIDRVREDIRGTVRDMGDVLVQNQRLQNDTLTQNQRESSANLNDRIALLDKNLGDRQREQSAGLKEKLDDMRATVEHRLTAIQQDNNKQLDDMRKIVDEKLQETIDKKMTHSFELVSKRLEEVYRGLGEMQTLAVSVGDLKKTLSNVKSRGILGEIQLGAILSDMLAPEQYTVNYRVKKDKDYFVEFAIKLPSDDDSFVYLPIDSKFPADTYNALITAYDSGDKAAVTAAEKELATRINSEAKDIHDKYIDPPQTTDFGIMFLPTEGLYAEVVKMGLIEELQHKYRINIAGPSTMAALLNSLQMGFRTLAIQKRSSEVWEVLAGVRAEFDTFAAALEKTKKHISQASTDLDTLIITRTNKMRKRLEKISDLEGEEAQIQTAEDEVTD